MTYAITGEAADLQARAKGICYKQTVEFPAGLTPQNIRDVVVGKIEALESLTETRHRATIAYPAAVAGSELTQFLNAIFGNTGIENLLPVRTAIMSQRFDQMWDAAYNLPQIESHPNKMPDNLIGHTHNFSRRISLG